jgi:hypothetical protein
MTSLRFARSSLALLMLTGMLVFVTVLAQAALGGTAPAAAAAAKHAGKTATSKPCYDTGTFKRRKVRVPTNCAKPRFVRKCYLTSTYDGKSYRQQVDCVLAHKPATAGSGGSGGGTPTTPAVTGPTGIPAGPAVGTEGVNWATASAAICGDHSTPTSDDGSANCTDGSWPYCTDGTSFVVVDPQNKLVVCLPNASVPSTGVCDDGSMPSSGGTDTDGTPLCSDGDDVYLPGDTADDSASYGTCDDGSNPGDGGASTSGPPLCADGTPAFYGP